GKIVMEFELIELNQKVDVSRLKSGVYFLQIGKSTEKICVE
ncbi:MAG: T9SS C-terminal target domain-containing protein, partial [Crocinitomicaceae bacterium]|nr:T9SS C-terminal target domain-containing protein [Crocinitomicaceae bacterium]